MKEGRKGGGGGNYFVDVIIIIASHDETVSVFDTFDINIWFIDRFEMRYSLCNRVH